MTQGIIVSEKNAYEIKHNVHRMLADIESSLKLFIGVYTSDLEPYVLGLFFYKFMSDKTEKMIAEALEDDNITYEEAWNDPEYRDDIIDEEIEMLGFVLEPKYLFSNIIKLIERNEFSIDFLEEAINAIMESTQGKASENALKGLFDDMDLRSRRLGWDDKTKTRFINVIIKNINRFENRTNLDDCDAIGVAFVELISTFALTSGKFNGGDFTPLSFSKLCSRLACVGLDNVGSAFDPCCGVANILLQIGQYVNCRCYYGQELSYKKYNVARMNLLLHGIRYTNFEIANIDTITDDKPLGEYKHQVQVAHPPISLRWGAPKHLLEDERFSKYGVLAPKTKGELMFVEHMIHHMEDGDSRIAVLLPPGVLFRGGTEETIRRHIIERQNLLDAVISLPAGCLYGAGIPVCCLIFRKDRSSNSDNICFIDASQHYSVAAIKRRLNYLTEEDMDRIVSAYIERKDIDKFCHIATIDEIRENEFNLNIPRYINTSEE